jgi:hypothetical protein
MPRNPGDVTPVHILKEFKKLWLTGTSVPNISRLLKKKYPNQEGLGPSNLDVILQRLKTESIQDVSKFTRAEINSRPIIKGTNQQGLSKAQEILNNPKKRQEFKKFANTRGVTLDQVRKKFGISSIHESGLRDLITKPVEAGSVTWETVEKRKKALNYLKTLPNGSDVNSSRIANATSHSVINLNHALEQPEIKAKKFNMIPFKGKNYIEHEKFKELYEKFEKNNKSILRRGSERGDAAFAKVLNEANYTAMGDEPWTASNVGSRRRLLNLSKRTSPTPIDIATDVKKYKIDIKGLSQAEIIKKIKSARKKELLDIQRKDPDFREYERQRRRKYQESLSEEQKIKQRELKRLASSPKGLVPVSYDHPQNKGLLWRDLVENSLKRQEGNPGYQNSHIKFLRKMDRYSLTSIPKVENVKLVDLNVIDPKTGKPKIITYENVFKHIDQNKNIYGTDSKTVINEYGKKRLLQLNPELRTELNTTVYGDEFDPTKAGSRRFTSAGAIHHTRGRVNNAFNVQFSLGPENRREGQLRKIFQTDYKYAGESLRGKVDAMKKYLASMKKEIPNIEVGFKNVSYGQRELMPEMIQRAGGTKLKNLLVKAAETNDGGVCNIFRADGGRIGYAAGSNCVRQMEMAFDNDPVKLSQDINKLPYEEGPINKVKNSATKFLQSPILRGAGKYGAIAAGGAVAAGFVKKFMNDDPTTYLSNEEQQKNLLMDMVTGSLDDTPQESPAIGDAYLPALGAATVAGTAAVAPSTIDAARSGALGAKKSGITKTALKTLGRGLAATASPLGLLATEPLYLADQIQQGDSLGEIATNPFNYMGAAFVGPATEFATKGGLNPMIAKTMRLGISPNVLKTVSRRFGLPGLALSAGISGYEMYQNKKAGRGLFDDG